MPRKQHSHTTTNNSSGIGAFMRRPIVQLFVVVVLAVIVYLLALNGGQSRLPGEINVDEAYQKYQAGAFFVDVRTQAEWDEYHAPNTLLIPLDQLPSRLKEIPSDKEIVVVCRSGNRSQQGRDILRSAGFTQVTSMAGGLKEWYAKGYPIEGAPPQ